MNKDELLKKAEEFEALPENWNNYNALKIDERTLNVTKLFIEYFCDKCEKYMENIEIFPTGRGTIQLEYEPSEEKYIEIEIFNNYLVLYSRIGRAHRTLKTNSILNIIELLLPSLQQSHLNLYFLLIC